MSRIINGELAMQKIEFVMNGRRYIFDVMSVDSIQVTTGICDNERVSVDMLCSGMDVKPCDSDFMEDVRALAKQYGLELVSIEVK